MFFDNKKNNGNDPQQLAEIMRRLNAICLMMIDNVRQPTPPTAVNEKPSSKHC